MKSQKGGALIGAIIAGVVMLGIAGTLFMSYVNANNFGVRIEAQLKAKYDDNRNILAQYGQKIGEMVQVPEMMKNDLKEVTQAAIEGRYGENGSQAVFQWIQEQNPQLDSAVYLQIQRAIEAGRDEFKNSQTGMLDIKRSYETALGLFWQGLWLKIAGFPKVDLDQYRIVSTGRADNAFEQGREDAPLQLRAPAPAASR
jgi:hypothetical protein